MLVTRYHLGRLQGLKSKLRLVSVRLDGTPAAEWDRLIYWQAERLPFEWRDPKGRPETPWR